MKLSCRVVVGAVLAMLVAFTSAGTALAAPDAPLVTAAAAIPPSCSINDNVGLTADQFISKCVRASVRSVFPGQLLGVTVGSIRQNRSLNADYKTAWKLISQQRFRK